ncbi:bilin-binding protein [Aphomia sociella]
MLRLVMFAFVAAASAGVLHEGKCPDIKPVENFNLTAYQGVWYEISKTPNDAEKNGKCAQAEYTVNGDVVKVKNTHIVEGVQKFVEGTAKLAEDANKSAKLLVTLNFGTVSRESPLSVIATDYQNYAIAYTCKYDEKNKSHNDSIWVLARAKKLEGDAKTAVDNFLKEHSKEIDASKLVQTDFAEDACKFTSSTALTEPQPNKQ